MTGVLKGLCHREGRLRPVAIRNTSPSWLTPCHLRPPFVSFADISPAGGITPQGEAFWCGAHDWRNGSIRSLRGLSILRRANIPFRRLCRHHTFSLFTITYNPKNLPGWGGFSVLSYPTVGARVSPAETGLVGAVNSRMMMLSLALVLYLAVTSSRIWVPTSLRRLAEARVRQ